MIGEQLGTTWSSVLVIVASGVGIFASIIVYTRLAGLRSFSKMSSFDFAMTVAMGSLVATVTVGSASLLDGVIGLGTLFAAQAAVAVARRRWQAGRYVDNEPLVLMAGRRVLEENLTLARVTEDDIRSKLREANVLNLDAVRAVVLETTGDISVLHGDDEIDLAILDSVRGVEQLRPQAEGGGVRREE